MFLEQARQLGAELAFFLTGHVPQRLRAAEGREGTAPKPKQVSRVNAWASRQQRLPSYANCRGFDALHNKRPSTCRDASVKMFRSGISQRRLPRCPSKRILRNWKRSTRR